MKITAITLTLLLIGSLAFAQEEMPAPSKPGGFPFKAKEDRLLVDFNWSNWVDGPEDIELNFGKSRGFGIKIMKDANIGESKFSVGYGLGFTSQNLHTDGFFTTDTLGNTLMAPLTGVDFKTNKLSLNFLDIPVEFRYRSKQLKKDNKLKIAVGGVAGILLQSHTKYKDDDVKVKLYEIENLELFHYGVTVRLGYGGWALSGNYYLSEVFESGKGPEFTTYTVGLMITPF